MQYTFATLSFSLPLSLSIAKVQLWKINLQWGHNILKESEREGVESETKQGAWKGEILH